MHTLSNLHNLPHNLNRLKCTPGDYFQKPIWKNRRCLTPKKKEKKRKKKDQGGKSSVLEAIADKKKEEKEKEQ